MKLFEVLTSPSSEASAPVQHIPNLPFHHPYALCTIISVTSNQTRHRCPSHFLPKLKIQVWGSLRILDMNLLPRARDTAWLPGWAWPPQFWQKHLFQSCLLSPLPLFSLSIIFTYCICHCCPTLSCGVALDFMSSSLTCRRRCSLAPAWTNSNPHTPSILRNQAATSFPDQPDKLKKAFLALAVSHFVFRPMVLIHLESEGNLRTFCIKHPHLSLGNKQLAILWAQFCSMVTAFAHHSLTSMHTWCS